MTENCQFLVNQCLLTFGNMFQTQFPTINAENVIVKKPDLYKVTSGRYTRIYKLK